MKYTSVVLSVIIVALFAIPVFASTSGAPGIGSDREIQISFPQSRKEESVEKDANPDVAKITLLLLAIGFMFASNVRVLKNGFEGKVSVEAISASVFTFLVPYNSIVYNLALGASIVAVMEYCHNPKEYWTSSAVFHISAIAVVLMLI